MRRSLVILHVCIVDGEKARRGMGMFANCTMLTKASRIRSLLAPMHPYNSHSRSFGVSRLILPLFADMGGLAVGTR
jgi:hypothetical protein